jgi:hypothetical protein
MKVLAFVLCVLERTDHSRIAIVGHEHAAMGGETKSHETNGTDSNSFPTKA